MLCWWGDPACGDKQEREVEKIIQCELWTSLLIQIFSPSSADKPHSMTSEADAAVPLRWWRHFCSYPGWTGSSLPKHPVGRWILPKLVSKSKIRLMSDLESEELEMKSCRWRPEDRGSVEWRILMLHADKQLESYFCNTKPVFSTVAPAEDTPPQPTPTFVPSWLSRLTAWSAACQTLSEVLPFMQPPACLPPLQLWWATSPVAASPAARCRLLQGAPARLSEPWTPWQTTA